MEKERKIEKVWRKISFAEAENEDDTYWANSTVDERLKELIALRKMVFGDKHRKIKKIVSQRSMYEEDN